MDELNNAQGPVEGNAGDAYDFSWDVMTEDVVNSELSLFVKEVNQVKKLLYELRDSNNYSTAAKAYNDLINFQLNSNGPVQRYYYANQSYFAPFMKSDSKPTGFYDMSAEKQRLFGFALKCQRDAAQCVKPLDQMWMLMLRVPLYYAFKVTQATVNLDDAGFDEDLYDEINSICKEVSELVNHNWTWMENSTDIACARYFKENFGKMELNTLNTGYRKERLHDYKRTFEVYCPKTFKEFSSNDYCLIYPDLQFLGCMMVIDEYMEVVAEALKEDIISKLEYCLGESKKLQAVIGSRIGKCSTDQFNMVLTAVEGLNNELYDFCQFALDVSKNYKGMISAAPYCFMKKPPASESIQPKYGFKPMPGNTLSDGTKYRELISKAGDALSQHCHEYVYLHGRDELK